MSNRGLYVFYGAVKNKEYFKFSDTSKVFNFGSFVFNIIVRYIIDHKGWVFSPRDLKKGKNDNIFFDKKNL